MVIYLKLSHKYQWFDKPNEDRKQHSVAVPTSGGIVFMLPIVLVAIFCSEFSLFSSNYFTLALVVLIMAGAYDDFKNLSVRFRLVLIAMASALLITSLFAIETINWLLLIVYFLGIIWWMNLFNFMDGANGMAVLHAIIALLAYFVFFFLFSNISFLSLIYLLFILSCLGAFLLFNFPYAKVFMGDSGSLSLSFLIAAIALYGIAHGIFNQWVVISFHLVFIVDATLTLLTRIKYKHSMTQAHNLHLYQSLIASGQSHAQVTILYAGATIVIAAITLGMRYLQVNPVIQASVLVIETLFLSIYWFNYHHKTKFKRFIR